MTRPPYPARWLRLGKIIERLTEGKALTKADREFLVAPLKRAWDADQLDEVFDLEPRPKLHKKTWEILIHYGMAGGYGPTRNAREAAVARVAKKFSIEKESVIRIVDRYVRDLWLPRPPLIPTADPADVLGRRRAKKK